MIALREVPAGGRPIAAWMARLRPALAVAALACGEPAAPPTPRVFASAGDRQVGLIDRPLPVPVEVMVVGGDERPLAGVLVAWGALNAHVAPAAPATGADGKARAEVVLGNRVGPAEAWALVLGDSIPFWFEARDDGGMTEPPPHDVLVPLTLATFDGSGEVVHPDFAPTPPFPLRRHLAITPYPNGNATLELPSVFGSDGWRVWQVPPGAPNPVVALPPVGHLSDPDLVHRPDVGDAWLYYRVADGRNRILVVRSSDGVRWDSPREVIAVPSHELLSPSVAYRGPGDWRMWSVNGGEAGCGGGSAVLEVRRSADGLAWGAPQRLGLAHDGLFPWHVDVQWIPARGEYWALYNAKQPGSCTTPALFLATSPDGVVWTPIRRPVLAKGAFPPFQDIVYRGTFWYDALAGDVWLWHSGARYENRRWTWSAAVERRRVDDLLAPAEVRVPLVFPPPPAELVDWP
jgi:hypothetical protein